MMRPCEKNIPFGGPPMNAHILLVDDEVEIADLVEVYLKNEEFIVHKFYDAASALACVKTCPIDLAILDVMLPQMSGFTLLRLIREEHNFPILMLTAKEDESDKITGLTLGADDYITKPFRPLELIARIKAQLRRYTKYNAREEDKQSEDTLAYSGLVLNRSTHEALLNERPLSLTPTEFSILWVLLENRGKVVSAAELFELVWGEKYFSSSSNTVMVHIRHLRDKMHDTADRPRYIKTVWGVGYKIE